MPSIRIKVIRSETCGAILAGEKDWPNEVVDARAFDELETELARAKDRLVQEGRVVEHWTGEYRRLSGELAAAQSELARVKGERDGIRDAVAKVGDFEQREHDLDETGVHTMYRNVRCEGCEFETAVDELVALAAALPEQEQSPQPATGADLET